ncbi:hypothetical protein HLV35_07570 [Eggerthellaceae bacterium zg-997]|nr:hypothetical protein [Eggerthellaceae bacterium zg-997]
MSGVMVDAGVLMAVLTATVAMVGVIAALLRDGHARQAEREEDARARAVTEAKLDAALAELREVSAAMARHGAQLNAMALAHAKVEGRLDAHERRISVLEGEHRSCMYTRMGGARRPRKGDANEPDASS